MKLLIAIILYALFFLMCYLGTGTVKKNMKSFYSYPDEIQNRIKKNEVLVDMIPSKKSSLSSFVSNMFMFTVVFCLIGLLFPTKNFSSLFLYYLLLGQGLNLFDLFVIDLLWWRNTKRTHIAGLDVESDLYKNPKKHIEAFYRGIVMFLCAALISAVIIGSI